MLGIPPFLLLLVLIYPLSGLAYQGSGSSEALQLAETYNHQHTDNTIKAYFVSEKLDGIRARWTGNQLLTRGGHLIYSPAWFTRQWPAIPLDGELWVGRARFEDVSSIVLSQTPDERWHEVVFKLFDIPDKTRPFEQRVTHMKALVKEVNQAWFGMIPQYTLTTIAALELALDEVTQKGGEGLMLHHRKAKYVQGRASHLLKVKRYQDSEARVLSYIEGKGEISGLMGALSVMTPDGITFKLGSGFSMAQRRSPPAIGSIVTYKYYGVTKNGKPRFASFLHVRSSKDITKRADPTLTELPAH